MEMRATPVRRATRSVRRKLLLLAVIGIPAAVATGAAPAAATGANAATNGRLAFVATEAGTTQVFTINPDGSGQTQVTHRPDGVGEYGLSWAPDGSEPARRAQRQPRHHLHDAPRRQRPSTDQPTLHRALPRRRRPRLHAVWHADRVQPRVRTVTNDNAAADAIFTMDADGTNVKQLTQKKRPTSTEDHAATWSPDGRRLAFQRLNTTASPVGHSAIYVMSASGTAHPPHHSQLARRKQPALVARRHPHPLQRRRRTRCRQGRQPLHRPPRRQRPDEAHPLHRRHEAGLRRRLVAGRHEDRLPLPGHRNRRPLHRGRRRVESAPTDASRARGEPAARRVGHGPGNPMRAAQFAF